MNLLDKKLWSLVETDGKTEAEVDEEADDYMNYESGRVREER